MIIFCTYLYLFKYSGAQLNLTTCILQASLKKQDMLFLRDHMVHLRKICTSQLLSFQCFGLVFYVDAVVCFVLLCVFISFRLSLFYVYCPMLHLSLDCTFLIFASVFSSVYLYWQTIQWMVKTLHGKLMIEQHEPNE